MWTNLSKPIIGLAPMDGITDAAFRETVDLISKPNILFTEFVPAEGVAHGATRLYSSLQKHKTTTPIVAQLFGVDPKAFYKAAVIVLELGFDGIDINMGCPDRNIMKKGGGASLINQRVLAATIIKAVKQAVKDWQNGKTLKSLSLRDEAFGWIERNKPLKVDRTYKPVSIKTRTGINQHDTVPWISTLLEVEPDAICIHARTFLQMYKGKADWDEIAKASLLTKGTNTLLFGNGDLNSVSQAKAHCKMYRCQGALIGRAALGNPWVFTNKSPLLSERFGTMLKHSKLYLKYRQKLKLFPMRKHLAWYCTGFAGSRILRDKLMKIESLVELKKLLIDFLNQPLKT
ncbi:hypothetical protein A2334_05305 [Candidatus Roizmanbacteria bacterium RIFOXYB2_FULL_38_10]|uniref:tRNA-dihydrouridine synthase n=1 Tax=Candidatus Roizmanbacteria bacterium RIFOXYD1_FULL_38_12 TaxID=1802093 RepID=A0A1F7L0G7_9BACT|nr:MAG: hypothetical protein A3K47_02425 [Candidatus Roizmanbacteria bacterium RIFOXYA2_FULL_38_14]OGK63627.1 MAG: hypothetical protein A3K27_02425 [Candidatus Roizmanbacteria bacterium RIFOXYA1_FULL_37_12]OGK65473.1 MAG: hypothetical protein A3K38_02425 [Candidatus Roizmanbacteria bacterium RIFOXYB1_FULL_40_23]OGK68258.1 MAG: hypothetical protein A2334_05305 [Candidatus Roizmanbacteria bacterium RIFOXYB2_FULL_38_10]OGK69878.1 MAG: hypothetical protein A3K21_02430 [Candidatus Roizmanbacteria ba